MAIGKAVTAAEPGIDMKPLFNMIGFNPHSDAQWAYCSSDARFNIPCCGRRWGKSIAAGHRMTYKSFIPESYNWIIGPTYTLGEKEFRVVWDDYRKLDLLRHCKKAYSVKQGDMRIQTPWGAVIEVKSSEKPDGLLGEGLSHAVMSESAKHSRATWEQYIEPALSDLRGSADFPSTPQGYNWYHGLWMLGQDPVNAGIYKSWSFPSWTNPIRYPGGANDIEIMRLRATVSSKYFDQEYGAQFTSMAGSIYDEWDETIHVRSHTFRPDWPNFLAFDYGFANAFVCLDIQIDPDDNVYVWREYYYSGLSTYEHGQALRLRSNPENYNVSGMWGDPRGADSAATLALMLGHVASHDVPWKHGVETIKRLLKPDATGTPKLFVDPSCVNLRRQLSQLHVKTSRRSHIDLQENTGDGNIQHKVDDHAADALRYFIGPYFVAGAGSHLSDVYGENYKGSESHDFFTLHSNISLDTGIHIGSFS